MSTEKEPSAETADRTSSTTSPKKGQKTCPSEAKQGLPRHRRLLTSRSFRWVQRQAARGTTDELTVLLRSVRPGTGRVGFTVSKKVGNAVTRNLVKRRLRHLVRLDKERFLNCNAVLIAHPPAASATFAELNAALDRAWGKASQALERHPKGRARRGKKPAR